MVYNRFCICGYKILHAPADEKRDMMLRSSRTTNLVAISLLLCGEKFTLNGEIQIIAVYDQKM